MSGLVKAVAKTFKKIVKSPVFKAVVIAAVVYFSVGAASAYFAAPAVGAGTAATGAAATTTTASGMMASKATYMAATEAAAASAASAGATGSVTAISGMQAKGAYMAANGATYAESMVALPAATSATATTNAASTGFSIMDSVPAGNETLAIGNTNAGMSLASNPVIPEVTKPAGMMGWLADNPVATMMLGQGVMGAAAGYSADKYADKRLDHEEDMRNNRGLMGYDYQGNGGVVASQRLPTVAETVAEPDASTVAPVQGQQVAAPVVAAQTAQTPVPKDQLPKLLESGQLA
jgi:hypothetical protein